MSEMIKKHLDAYANASWNEFRASLADNVMYEEKATRSRVQGADDYIKAVQRWKTAFPDLKATVVDQVIAGDKAIIEVKWEGTHTGSFEGPFGSIAPTNKRGGVDAVLVYTIKDDKVMELHHYFDLLTVLVQLGVAPTLGAAAKPAQAPSPPPH